MGKENDVHLNIRALKRLYTKAPVHQNVRAPKCPYTETSYTDKSGSYLADTSAVCHPESGVPLNKLILKAFILKVSNTIIARLDAAIT